MLHPVFVSCRPLILASASPRRVELCSMLCPDIQSIDPGPGEPLPMSGEAPVDYVQRAALHKASVVAHQHPQAVVLGADTAVVLAHGPVEEALHKGTIFGKPGNAAQALSMLEALNGKEHMVITACAMCRPDGTQHCFADSAIVRMGVWPRNTLEAYANSGECFDKAGAYAVQGLGAFLIDSINGAWTSVVGLPVPRVAQYFLEHGDICTRT